MNKSVCVIFISLWTTKHKMTSAWTSGRPCDHVINKCQPRHNQKALATKKIPKLTLLNSPPLSFGRSSLVMFATCATVDHDSPLVIANITFSYTNSWCKYCRLSSPSNSFQWKQLLRRSIPSSLWNNTSDMRFQDNRSCVLMRTNVLHSKWYILYRRDFGCITRICFVFQVSINKCARR